MSAFLRLVPRDNTSPLRPTLCNEHSDEIASAMAPVGEAAIRSAIMLLARSENIAARLSAHGLDLHNEHRLVSRSPTSDIGPQSWPPSLMYSSSCRRARDPRIFETIPRIMTKPNTIAKLIIGE